MSLSQQDLVQLMTKEATDVVFERMDPRDAYALENEEKEKCPALQRGERYTVQGLELNVHGTLIVENLHKTAEDLVRTKQLFLYPETSRVIINHHAYSSFCFRLAD